MTYLKRLIKDLNTSIGEKQINGTMRKKRVSTRELGTNPRAKGTNPRAKNNSQNDKSGENMEKKRFVVLELTEDEEKELNQRRDEFFREKSALGRIPICINEIDLDEWVKAFAIASPYDEEIFSLFHFYEDGKDIMRVN